MEENQMNIKDELSSQSDKPAGQPAAEKMHQFDNSKMKYERNGGRLLVWVAILVVAAVATGLFLFVTEPGKQLIGLASTTPAVETQTSSSASTIPQAEETTLPPERTFADEDADSTIDQAIDDIETGLSDLDQTTDFAAPDSELELGL